MKSKRYKNLPTKTKNLSAETLEKLLPVIKNNCTTKFDESIDLSIQINNKQKKIRTISIWKIDPKSGFPICFYQKIVGEVFLI